MSSPRTAILASGFAFWNNSALFASREAAQLSTDQVHRVNLPTVGRSLEMCSADVVLSQIQWFTCVRPTNRHTEKQVKLFEFGLASSSSSLGHKVLIEFSFLSCFHRLPFVHPDQIQQFLVSILFTCGSQHKIFVQCGREPRCQQTILCKGVPLLLCRTYFPRNFSGSS